MARKNRIVVENGLYHVTARIAHREFLLEDASIKEWMVWQMYDVADFCGLELYAWNIMDNHIHIFLRVPVVLERYWTDSSEQPLAAWRSMRPAECRSPRWTPDLSDKPCPITAAGDCPSREAIVKAVSDGVPVATIPHHEVGFGMSDDEMLERLRKLYSYNIDRVSDIEWNAPKAIKGVSHPRDWKWCSYAVACGDSPLSKKPIGGKTVYDKTPLVERARRGYESLFGCGWDEVKGRLDAVFEDRLPEGFDIRDIDKVLKGEMGMRMTQLIKAVSLSRLAFFSPRREFVKETYKSIGTRFPGQGYRSVDFLAGFGWPDDSRLAA